jgi:hypothetical protein
LAPEGAAKAAETLNSSLLIEAGGKAGAKKMRVRLSANTGFAAALGNTPFKIENQTHTTIDLEVEFTTRRRGRRRTTA